MPATEHTAADIFEVKEVDPLVPAGHVAHFEFAVIRVIGGVPIERDGKAISAVQVTIDGRHTTIRLSDINQTMASFSRGVTGLRMEARKYKGRETVYIILQSSTPPSTLPNRIARGEAFRDALVEHMQLPLVTRRSILAQRTAHKITSSDTDSNTKAATPSYEKPGGIAMPR